MILREPKLEDVELDGLAPATVMGAEGTREEALVVVLLDAGVCKCP